MPLKLREAVQQEFFGKVLKETNFVNCKFSENFLNKISQFMKEYICRPGEIIYNQNEIDNKVFFVIKGVIELFCKDSLK